MYDVIIVGTGPGGASVALPLAQQKLKVLILEWGGDVSFGSISSLLHISGTPGKGFFINAELFTILRGITVGGSAAINFATAFPPPVAMFDKYGIELSQPFQSLQNRVPIDTLGDHLVGPMAGRLENAAIELGLPWERLNKFIYQEQCRVECHRCIYGCPYGAKWHPGMLVSHSVNAGAELKCYAKVTRVIIENGIAVGVEYIKDGQVYRVFGNKIVISAGGLGTPIILRNSGLNHVGEQLFVDPVVAAIGVMSEAVGSGREISMVSGMINERAGYTISDMTLPRPLHYFFSGLVGQFTAHRKSLTMMVKGRDSMDGHITNNGKPRKALSFSDNQSLYAGSVMAREVLMHAGAKKVYFSRPFAAHPGGTVAIGRHVDSDLRTDYKNLYVCDSSVIPEPWGLPPTLTLMCLGTRLAKSINDVG